MKTRYLKILSNCTLLKASVMLREFSSVTRVKVHTIMDANSLIQFCILEGLCESFLQGRFQRS